MSAYRVFFLDTQGLQTYNIGCLQEQYLACFMRFPCNGAKEAPYAIVFFPGIDPGQKYKRTRGFQGG